MYKYLSCVAAQQKFLYYSDSDSETEFSEYDQIGTLFFLLFSYAIFGVTMNNYGAPIFRSNSRFHRGLMKAGISFLANFVSVVPNRLFLLARYTHFFFERHLISMQ